ncbi:MAG: sulfite exporter TauE/SafE family protein [Usitatibacter sp.]
MDSFAPERLLVAGAIAALAGVIRGITGFGGAMVMSPPLALLLGPLLAVPVVLLLESVVAAPMLVQLRHLVRPRVIGPIIAMACVTVPLGTWILVSADPQLMRRVIAAVVIVFSLLLLRGWRYAARQRLATALGLGAVSGTMVGATSMGGPPVILYLLAGPDPIETTRANLTYFVGAISLAGITMLWLNGVLGARELRLAAILAPGYYLGMVSGTRLFSRFNDTRFRRFTLVFMMAVAAGILLA